MCAVAFAVDPHGICDIFPLPFQQHHQEKEQQQHPQTTEAGEEAPPYGHMRLLMERGPPGALLTIQQHLEGVLAGPSCCGTSASEGCSEAAVRELFFYLWGPAGTTEVGCDVSTAVSRRYPGTHPNSSSLSVFGWAVAA